MPMCARCHKRVAVVFVTKIENGEKISEGICIKCAKEIGLPVENMLGDVYKRFGLTPEQLDDMENDLNNMIAEQGGLPSENDDNEDAGAPAIDFPKLFRDSGIFSADGKEALSTPNAEIGKSKRREGKGKEEVS